MHIFLTEKESGLAKGFLSYAQGIRGLRCSVFDGDANDAVELQRQLTEAGPDFVVNTLQFDDLNLVEQSPDRAWQLNAILPDHLAHICLDLGAALIQISSDEVIGEVRNGTFHEKDTVHPLNTFGETKWQGEEAVRQLLKRHVILRFGTLFDGDAGSAWVSQILNEAQKPQDMQEAADITLSPTALSDASRVITAIIQQLDAGADCWGTYHYAGVEPISRAHFAEQVIELAQERGLLTGAEMVRGVSATAMGLAGKQALHREMSCQKIMDHYGIKQRSWRPALVEAIEQAADQKDADQQAADEKEEPSV